MFANDCLSSYKAQWVVSVPSETEEEVLTQQFLCPNRCPIAQRSSFGIRRTYL